VPAAAADLQKILHVTFAVKLLEQRKVAGAEA
jgi:hypothetical protein